MSVESFGKTLRWLYGKSSEYVEDSDLEGVMEFTSIVNLLGLDGLVQVCELQLSKTLRKYPLS